MTEEEDGEDKKDEGGYRCPRCGCKHFLSAGGWTRHRRKSTVRARVCRNCGRRVITVEKIKEDND